MLLWGLNQADVSWATPSAIKAEQTFVVHLFPLRRHVPQQAQTSIFHKPYTAAHTDFRRRWPEGDTIFYVCACVCIFLRTRSRAFSSFSKALMTTAGTQEEKERKLYPGKAKKARMHIYAGEDSSMCWKEYCTVSHMTGVLLSFPINELWQIPSQSSVSISLCLKWTS